jgi:hypothetical protein
MGYRTHDDTPGRRQRRRQRRLRAIAMLVALIVVALLLWLFISGFGGCDFGEGPGAPGTEDDGTGAGATATGPGSTDDPPADPRVSSDPENPDDATGDTDGSGTVDQTTIRGPYVLRFDPGPNDMHAMFSAKLTTPDGKGVTVDDGGAMRVETFVDALVEELNRRQQSFATASGGPRRLYLEIFEGTQGDATIDEQTRDRITVRLTDEVRPWLQVEWVTPADLAAILADRTGD